MSPQKMGAKGFAEFLLCEKYNRKEKIYLQNWSVYSAGKTTYTLKIQHGAMIAERSAVRNRKPRKQNPLYEHSENNTKILGGRNERITENQNQA